MNDEIGKGIFTRSKTRIIGVTVLTGTAVLLFSFQNFTSNSNQQGQTSAASTNSNNEMEVWTKGLDPTLHSAITAIDQKYSSQLANLSKCPGRIRELKIESLRLKLDLLRASLYTNLSLAGINATQNFLSEGSRNIKILMNELSAIPRPEVHVISMYEPKNKSSEPIHIHVTGSGTGILLLSSYESAHFEVETAPEANLKRVIVHGYKPQKISGVDISIIERRDNPNSFNLVAYNPDYAKTLLDFIMTDEIRRTGTCLDFSLASHQGSYSGNTATAGEYSVNLSMMAATTDVPMMIAMDINGECLTQDSIRGGGQYPDQSKQACISKCKDFFNSASALAKVYDCRFLAANKDDVVLAGRPPLASSSQVGQCVIQDSIRGGTRLSKQSKKSCINQCRVFLSEASPIAHVYDCRLISGGKEEIVLPGRTAL